MDWLTPAIRSEHEVMGLPLKKYFDHDEQTSLLDYFLDLDVHGTELYLGRSGR